MGRAWLEGAWWGCAGRTDCEGWRSCAGHKDSVFATDTGESLHLLLNRHQILHHLRWFGWPPWNTHLLASLEYSFAASCGATPLSLGHSAAESWGVACTAGPLWVSPALVAHSIGPRRGLGRDERPAPSGPLRAPCWHSEPGSDTMPGAISCSWPQRALCGGAWEVSA